MAQPHRSALVRAAALTPFLGRSAEDLDRGGDAADGGGLGDPARMVRRAAPTRPVGRSSSSRPPTAGSPRACSASTDGARLLTDLRHTTELLDEAAAEGRTTAGVLATWLARQRAEDLDTVSADRVRRMDSDAAAVHLMTIHASKGLQFPVVYAPSLSDLYPRRDEHPLYHDGDGTRCVDVSGGGGMREAAELAAPGGLGRGAAQALRRRHPRPVPAGRVVGAERAEHDDLGAAPTRLRPPPR